MRFSPITKMGFSLYVELVCPYNARQHSYAQDVVPASTGILNTLAPAFPDGFVAGIPLDHMEIMLLWQPLRGAARREGTTNPSWSWTGWRLAGGQVRTGLIEVWRDGTLWFKLSNSDGISSSKNFVRIEIGTYPREAPQLDAFLFVQTSSAVFTVMAKVKAFQEPPEADVRFRKNHW